MKYVPIICMFFGVFFSIQPVKVADRAAELNAIFRTGYSAEGVQLARLIAKKEVAEIQRLIDENVQLGIERLIEWYQLSLLADFYEIAPKLLYSLFLKQRGLAPRYFFYNSTSLLLREALEEANDVGAFFGVRYLLLFSDSLGSVREHLSRACQTAKLKNFSCTAILLQNFLD